MSERTAVYRLYDADKVLLYIGMTDDPDRRFAEHEVDKTWWPLVVDRVVEWHDSRKAASVAEFAAIRSERTVHNKHGSPWAVKPPEPGCMPISEARAEFTEVVNAVRLQDKTVRLTRRGTQQAAAIVPTDVLDLIEAVGGISYARDLLRGHIEALKGDG